MKKIFKLLILSTCLLITGLFFVGCSKNYSEEISFFNYGENIDEETIKEFEKQYGIKLILKLLMIWKLCIKRLIIQELHMMLF